MYDIPFDRSFLQLSNVIRHVVPSTDRKLELTAKASMAQPISQPAVCSNGLKRDKCPMKVTNITAHFSACRNSESIVTYMIVLRILEDWLLLSWQNR